MSIAFTVRMVPPKTTAQQKGQRAVTRPDGKTFIMHYKKKKTVQAESDLMTMFRPYVPAEPLDGPLYVLMRFTYPWKKTEKKKNLALGELPMDKRPDADNIFKTAGDVMTKLLFYHDDSQIADLRIQKFWGDDPGITVVIRKIEAKEPEG